MNRRNGGVTKNVVVGGKRTSMCLEPLVWRLLEEVCIRQGLTLHQLCTRIDAKDSGDGSLTSAVRMHVLEYFVAAATEDGHRRCGHGPLHGPLHDQEARAA